ncbi:FAD-dependent oxidoreductase [Granulicella sp. L60]|uniref:FAD-dependent oxidoreductase n=1 Tax=Granulicella sp. L60 TaxID=1641866 RepID=UPI00131DE5E7|nr:FAD-dependent oxidoreductase [Granulicella sp. L60]
MTEQSDRDFGNGVPLVDLPEGEIVAGKVKDQDVVVVRRGKEILAVDALCSHYHGPLKDGIVVGNTIRCPLHHACFSLKTGEALAAPALDPLQCWRTEQVGDLVFVREILKAELASQASSQTPESVVIVGGGAAGLCAAEMLRRERYRGRITILSADGDAPYDRPNISKDFLAGNAPPEWMPLRVPDYYDTHNIDLLLNTRVSSIDRVQKQVALESGKTYKYGALLLATGAQPVPLEVEGLDAASIYYLRSFDDARHLAVAVGSAKRVVIVGAGFIGLETAASLRARGIEVHVVAPGSTPLGKVLGDEVGRFVRELHESHGVVFHLGRRLASVTDHAVTLDDGSQIHGVYLIVAGIGVHPRLELAEQAGLTIDRGVVVNRYLMTSDPNIYAAGDIARWPDPHSGKSIRVEHFVIAQRQGQTVARNILGKQEPFEAVPFFWSQHYDVAINYVGYPEFFDQSRITGSIEERDCQIDYMLAGETVAVATIGRDKVSLEAELQFESVRADDQVQ